MTGHVGFAGKEGKCVTGGHARGRHVDVTCAREDEAVAWHDAAVAVAVVPHTVALTALPVHWYVVSPVRHRFNALKVV